MLNSVWKINNKDFTSENLNVTDNKTTAVQTNHPSDIIRMSQNATELTYHYKINGDRSPRLLLYPFWTSKSSSNTPNHDYIFLSIPKPA